MKKIKKMSLYEMGQQLSQVSKAELMALVGGGEFAGTCYFDCLTAAGTSLGFVMNEDAMLLNYGRTYYGVDHPSAYGPDGTPTNKEYRDYASAGIKDYQNRVHDIARTQFGYVCDLTLSGLIQGETGGGCKVILVMKCDNYDHAVLYRDYNPDTKKFTVWDPALNKDIQVNPWEFTSTIIGVR